MCNKGRFKRRPFYFDTGIPPSVKSALKSHGNGQILKPEQYGYINQRDVVTSYDQFIRQLVIATRLKVKNDIAQKLNKRAMQQF